MCLALTDSPSGVPQVLPDVQLSPGPLPDLPVCSEMQLFLKGEAWFVEQEDPQGHVWGRDIRHCKPQELEKTAMLRI